MPFNLNNTVGNILRGHSVRSSVLSGLAASGLSGPLRSVVMALREKRSAADVYITEIDTGERIQLAYVPEKVTGRDSARFQSYNIIERGEVKIPKGENLKEISWDAILPGEGMTDYAFIKSYAWRKPEAVIRLWSRWKSEGSKLNILITQTGINQSVYLQDFSATPEGAMGNFRYHISFIEAKDLVVKTVEEVDAENAIAEAEEAGNGEALPELNDRAMPPLPSTTPFGMDETLWEVAQSTLGSGAKWIELAGMNPDIRDVENIPAGTVLNIR
ncbi:MAG: hypothetical protein IJ741_03700 [Schwartzia sp.]|nr:hypothetical protein [Schwartzia sp. (in: firmicutes)]